MYVVENVKLTSLRSVEEYFEELSEGSRRMTDRLAGGLFCVT